MTAAVPAFVGVAGADVGPTAPAAGGTSAGASGGNGGGKPATVTICHATDADNHPYVELTVDQSAVDGNGANDHTLHTGPLWQPGDQAARVTWGDIIPPNPTIGYPGSEAYLAGGDAWLSAGCAAPAPAVVAPIATVSGSCTAADFTLTAGSAPTSFTITTVGVPAPQVVSLAAGQTQHALVTLDATHSGATVTATGLTPATFSRDPACDGDGSNGDGGSSGGGGSNSGGSNSDGSSNSGGGSNSHGSSSGAGGSNSDGSSNGGGGGKPGGVLVANPAVTASTACATGITVVLTNPAGTAPATFAVVTVSGRLLPITVQPDQTVRRSFAVAEDTTGRVTVTAPGLGSRTFRYAKDCTGVLGEKLVRHRRHRHQQANGVVTPGVAAGRTPTSTLPFTGAPTGELAALALAMLALGTGLVRAGRQPYPARRRV